MTLPGIHQRWISSNTPPHMAGKIDPDKAFRLIHPLGKGKRPSTQKAKFTKGSFLEKETPDQVTNPPAVFKHTSIVIAGLLATGFITILLVASYLLYNTKEPPPPPPPPKPEKVFSQAKAHQAITDTLRNFLKCSTTEERLAYVLNPSSEKEAMIDYYDHRKNLDTPLWKIQLIEPANIEGLPIWMVAYLDVKKNLRYARLERSGDNILIQWSSSYAYSQLPWETFAVTQPEEPVQMRCFALRHSGPLPPGYDPATHLGFVIENQRGEFTALAVMDKKTKDAKVLNTIAPRSRNPVNLMLKYTALPGGTRQLTITELLHFQWHQPTGLSKGQPLKLNN